MKRLVLLSTLLSVLASCGQKQVIEVSGNETPASVVYLLKDNQVNRFADYIPTVSKFDRVTAGAGVEITEITDSTFVLDIQVPLSTLTLWQGEQPLTLVVEDSRVPQSDFPHLFTTWYKQETREVGIGYTSLPSSVVAMWQNVRLSDECLSLSGGDLIITLPASLPDCGSRSSYLRVFAANDTIALSDIVLPLVDGKIVTASDQLDPQDVILQPASRMDESVDQCARTVFTARSGHTMRELATVINEGTAIYGNHHTLGHRSDDATRALFDSVMQGDSLRSVAKLILLNKLFLTIPGVPTSYQNDIPEVEQLAQHRLNNILFLYGDYTPLYADDHAMVFLRSYLGEGILVGINTGDRAADCCFTLPGGLRSCAGHMMNLRIEANDAVLRSL